MKMLLIEGFIIAGVLWYIVRYTLKERQPKVFLKKFFACAVTAWIAEGSCITFYGFYTYSPAWHFYIANVPLVVILVWPAVIHSASVLSSSLLRPNSRLTPLIAGCIVLTDAMLIEPISVNFNMWHWNQPGLFGVPLIGLMGWGGFACFAVGFFMPIDRLGQKWFKLPIRIAASVIGTHLFLLFSYWVFFKWMIFSISPTFSASAVWVISAILFSLFLFTSTGHRVELKTLVSRLPAALFFYILLFSQKDSPTPLIIYALALILPYIAIVINASFSNKPFKLNHSTMAAKRAVRK